VGLAVLTCARRFLDLGGDVVSLRWDVADPGVVHGPSIDDVWSRAVPGELPCATWNAPTTCNSSESAGRSSGGSG
jgi:hypothetical protein